jgi:hypothetical protein
MEATASPTHEDAQSQSSLAESAPETQASVGTQSQQAAQMPPASKSIAEALAPKKRIRKQTQKPQSSEPPKTESSLRAALLAARERRNELNKLAHVETNAVKNALRKIDRVKANAKTLSSNDLMEVYMMRETYARGKKGTECKASVT